MDHLVTDLRYAIRGLMKAPGVATIAVIALALGVGLTTLMFSIVYGIMYRGLPFEGGDRIISVHQNNPSRDIVRGSLTAPDFIDYRERQRSFEDLSASYVRTVVLTVGESPERYSGAMLTGNAMGSIGMNPLIGRGITEDDARPDAAPVVVLGFQPWRDQFGSDPLVLGRTVRVDGSPATVVGVMPEGIEFPSNQQIWIPLRIDPLASPRGEGTTYGVFGRLKEGVSVEAATADLDRIAAELAAAYPESNGGFVPTLEPFERGSDNGVNAALLTMLAGVFMVLLIACANVANLLLARAAVRTRDVAVRVSLGASRSRVVSQMMAESLVLALVGAGLGGVLAKIGIGIFRNAVAGDPPPFWMKFELDGPIFAFVALITVVAAVVSGAVPALRASATDLNAVLKDESRGSSSLHIGRLSRGLVIAEVAMSVALLVGAGLIVRSALMVDDIVLPYRTDDVLTARVVLAPDRFPDTDSRRRFWTEAEARIGALPGVESVAMVDELPGLGSPYGPVQIEGESYASDREVPRAHYAHVSPAFFSTFGAAPLQGRLFTILDDDASAPVAIVNASYVRKHFPDGAALGRRIKVGGTAGTAPWREIVGVVPDLGMNQVANANQPETDGLYLPMAQDLFGYASIAVGAKGSPLALTKAVRDAIVAIDPDTPIFFVDTLRGRIDSAVWYYRVFGELFSAFGAAALFLASVGLYGVMSFSVTSRIPEIGIRMALGAERGQVRSLILGQGMRQIGLGLVIGTGLAVLLAQGLTILIVGARIWDPATYLFVLLALGLTGFAASAIPALRATRVDPSDALRAG